MREPLHQVAGIRLRNAGKILYYHSAGMRLEAGEYVVIETTRGPEIGKVVIAPGEVVVNELGNEDLRPILRLATDGDLRRMDDLRTRAREILPEVRRMAEEVSFPAHIDGADFTLDGRRLMFSFTSEERLDYRDFLRKAGEHFGAKVDMRQMGARDRAKLAGGYGICGRELCCANWLTTFPSISIRMAKEQELPLNPQKISGLCGRLLCCLSYEEQGYREMRKTLPKLGQRCSTPTGEGKVIAVNILRRHVTLVVDGQRVEVTDRDLGLVVRWDTASKSGEPPPSLTPAEAVEQGLLTPEEAAAMEQEAEPEVDDWMTAPRADSGRGRLPGGGPRKTIRARPPAAPLAGEAPAQPAGRGRPARPQRPAQHAVTGDRRDRGPGARRDSGAQARQPSGPGGASRAFQRTAQPPVQPGGPGLPAADEAGQQPAQRGRRRRGRRGGGGSGVGEARGGPPAP
jgi:cell fate regulator YaaT (PSP1 superfamily)